MNPSALQCTCKYWNRPLHYNNKCLIKSRLSYGVSPLCLCSERASAQSRCTVGQVHKGEDSKQLIELFTPEDVWAVVSGCSQPHQVRYLACPP